MVQDTSACVTRHGVTHRKPLHIARSCKFKCRHGTLFEEACSLRFRFVFSPLLLATILEGFALILLFQFTFYCLLLCCFQFRASKFKEWEGGNRGDKGDMY